MQCEGTKLIFSNENFKCLLRWIHRHFYKNHLLDNNFLLKSGITVSLFDKKKISPRRHRILYSWGLIKNLSVLK